MRGAIGRRINNPNHFLNSTTPFSLQSSFSFCSGSGRGRGVPSSPFQFTPTKPTAPGQPDTESKPDPPQSGLGHGRGRPAVPSSPVFPSFSSFISSAKDGAGAGRGRSVSESDHPSQPTESTQPSEPNLPSSLRLLLPGAGRGNVGAKQQPPTPVSTPPIKEENRHIRARSHPEADSVSAQPKLNKEDAMKHTMRILSQGGDGEREGVSRSAGPGLSASPGRGRGRGGRGDFRRREMEEDDDDEDGSGLYLGDNADGEKLANKIGVENMNMLVEGFEEMSDRVLPSPMDDAYIDALHTNYMIECEPEYLMGDFETNPDIDEEPPIPLRDALEKMKPFLMAYEGIESHEEWEEAINEVMERVPLLKEIVNYYSGPDRVTAKKQQEELERVAKTIPESAPASMMRFSNRAVLSLQSNPGWGFNKKCQFMDKLVLEVSRNH
ncbi:hypothetical protein EZV62_014643 [Acer yangbiense]|uniref:Uncharacterized protein n=1 Tax=Acer yangbiense TaxID=1000413 RepID=A0A5C7HSU0_9ROSI|nr:hypothetical protein EZV62_014643 [Acer yangbiense]